MPTHSKELEIVQDDVGPVRATPAENAATGRRMSDGEGCSGQSAPDEAAAAAAAAPVQPEVGECPAPEETAPDDSAARHASGDSAQSSDGNSSCSSPGGRRCHGFCSCTADADAEDSGDARDDKARFVASVYLSRRSAGSAGPRLKLALRDSNGLATKSVPLPDPGEDDDMVSVQLPDQDEQSLADIDMIDLSCKFDGDDDQPTEDPAPAETQHEQSPAERDDEASSNANSLQGDMTQLKLQPTFCDSTSGSDSETVRSVTLRGSAGGLQRLYRRGDPERRRAPPPLAVRLATRRRRLGLVRCPRRAASVFVSLVSVQDRHSGRQQLFPVTRWLSARLYRLSELDSSLPQLVTDPLQVTLRRAELLHKRHAYSYRPQHYHDKAKKLADLPEEEKFPEMDEHFASIREAVLESCAGLGSAADGWRSFKEMEESFKPALGGGDADVPAIWHTDQWFGAQRVTGLDPTLITLCAAIPDKLGVDADMLSPFLGGLSLEQAVHKKRLFVVDLEILDDLDAIDGTELCAPVALFFRDKWADLVPVAIQLNQTKGADNPVFLPSDPGNLWLLAKMFYNCAEAQHHQLSTLAVSFLLLEGLAISVHRNLSPSHPVFRLLAPHLHRQLAAAELARHELLGPDGWLERCGQLTSTGRLQLVTRLLRSWRLDTCAVVPRQVAARGVADPKVLPYYPYRDDATALYTGIERYVRTCLQPVYSDEARLAGDWELVQWRRELTRSAERGGLGLRGVPGGTHSGFGDLGQLVEVVTAIISTSTAGHSASSRHQRLQYSLPANYPLRLYGLPPRSRGCRPSAAELLRLLPGPRAMQEVCAVTEMLSQPSRAQPLFPESDVKYMWDAVSATATEQLREATMRVAINRVTQNLHAAFPYRSMVGGYLNNSVGEGLRPRGYRT